MVTTGFRGGGGGFRAQCGALNSAVMAVSLLYGRVRAEEDNQCASDMTKLLCERFQQEMGYLTCDVLRDIYQCSSAQPGEGGTVYHTGAKLAVEVILSAHRSCPTCGGFDGAVKKHLQNREVS
jgi:C_GCAxxG_C_C family probable redox protein